jgi:hypothetical protein
VENSECQTPKQAQSQRRASRKRLDQSAAERVCEQERPARAPIFSFHQGMRKILSISRHTRCILRKSLRGGDLGWHWHHILREFGFGRYMRQ